MYYSEDTIEEVRSRNDIVDLISTYVKLTRRGANYLGLCPFHGEKTPSFTVSPSKQIFRCFGCGAGGNAITFLMRYENMGFVEALKQLADRAGVTLPEVNDEKAKKYADIRTKLFEINREAARFYYGELIGEKGKDALQYLRGRGLSDKTIKRFGLGYSPKGFGILYQLLKEKGYDDGILKQSGLFSLKEDKGGGDRFWNRVMFPIIDPSGKVIGFGGRLMGDGNPKYLNSPETPIFYKGRNLFSLNFAKISREKYLILCEGYMDVISLYQAGFTNAVASLGTAFTADQARLLSKYTDTLVLMYDSDAAGIKAIQKVIPIAREAGILTKIVDLQPYKDPDEFVKNRGSEDLRERIEKAENSFEFELRIGEKEHDVGDPAERSIHIKNMAKKILDIENKLERETYISVLAERYHISGEILRESVNQLGLQKELQDGYKMVEEKVKRQKAVNGDEGILRANRLLISWITENPTLYFKIKGMLSPEDFETDLYKNIAKSLFEQIEKDGEPKPAMLVSGYETEEEQGEVAMLFAEKLEMDVEGEAFKKAFLETVKKIKQEGIDRAMKKAAEEGDMEEMSLLISEQKQISEIKIL